MLLALSSLLFVIAYWLSIVHQEDGAGLIAGGLAFACACLGVLSMFLGRRRGRHR